MFDPYAPMIFSVLVKDAHHMTGMFECFVEVQEPQLHDFGKTPPEPLERYTISAIANTPLEATQRAFQQMYERIEKENRP